MSVKSVNPHKSSMRGTCHLSHFPDEAARPQTHTLVTDGTWIGAWEPRSRVPLLLGGSRPVLPHPISNIVLHDLDGAIQMCG